MSLQKKKEMELKKKSYSETFKNSTIVKSIFRMLHYLVLKYLMKKEKKAHRLALDFVENYRRDHYVKGLYIFGKYATGKSYLLSAIAQALAEKNMTVLFVYMPDLVRSIRQGMNEGNMEERINQLKQGRYFNDG